MKKLVKSYTFDPATKTITFREPFTLPQFLLITNTRTNTIIYNFADPALGGSVDGQSLVLVYDTSAMLASDQLQIFVESDDESPTILRSILQMLMAPLGYDKSLGRSRVTAVVESGTVSTVSNLSQIDAIQGRVLMNGANLQAWAGANRSLIS